MTVEASLRIGAHVAPSHDAENVERRYRERIEEIGVELARLEQRDASWNVARIIITLGLFPSLFCWWYQLLPGWLIAVHAIAVLGVAMRHDAILERLKIARALRQCHQRQLARRRRQWEEIPVPSAPTSLAQHATARDLDLFGVRSVFHWLCVAHTQRGRQLLGEWLTVPADTETLEHRQRLVRALSGEFDWREQLQLHGMLLGPDADAGHKFVEWATGRGWLTSRPWLLIIARLVPVVALGTGVGYALNVLPPYLAFGIVVLVAVVNLVLSALYVGAVHDVFHTVSGASDQVGRYRAMLDVAARLPDHVGAVDPGGADLRELAREGIACLDQLRHIVQVADARRGGLMGVIVLLLQLSLLWEFHVLAWLETWQRRHGRHAEAWFQAIGELEALASLATAAHDQPDWTFPRIDARLEHVDAVGLGHPLLADDRRVANDVRLGPRGSFLLVTGSNMSGKSTLLRSLGVNVLLGQAGGVVCAERLEFPPVDVRTSMRVADSLADGVSLFFAELLRLKAVVDHCPVARQSGRVLLYLLDEILHGTNSRERQTAVARVIKHLLEQGALGAISTHDLELASAPEIASACQVVHFRETLGWDGQQRTMSFDYRVRPGLSPTTNALVLLEMVGLASPEGEPEK